MANLTKPLGVALHFYSNRKKSKKSNGLYFMVPNGSVCHFPMKIGVRVPAIELAGGSTWLSKCSKKSGPQSRGKFPGGASKTYRRCSAGDVLHKNSGRLVTGIHWYTLIMYFCRYYIYIFICVRNKSYKWLTEEGSKICFGGVIFRHERMNQKRNSDYLWVISKNYSHYFYCWWKKSCTSWYGKYPIIHRVSYMLGGAGFLPSTVVKTLFIIILIILLFFRRLSWGRSPVVELLVRVRVIWKLMETLGLGTTTDRNIWNSNHLQ